MIWCTEEDVKWTIVSRLHKKKSFANVVKAPPISKSAFSLLIFPNDYDPNGTPAVKNQAPRSNTPKSKSAFNRLSYLADYPLNFLGENVVGRPCSLLATKTGT